LKKKKNHQKQEYRRKIIHVNTLIYGAKNTIITDDDGDVYIMTFININNNESDVDLVARCNNNNVIISRVHSTKYTLPSGKTID
jgi:hypothetical protein